MIGRPLRIHWNDTDTPEALKEAYQSQTDINIRTRVHLLWLVRSGCRSRRHRRLSALTTAALRDGSSGTGTEVCTRWYPAEWEEWVSPGSER